MKNLMIILFFILPSVIFSQSVFHFSQIETVNGNDKTVFKVNGIIEINQDGTEFKLSYLGTDVVEKISQYFYEKYTDIHENFFYEIDNPDKELFSVFTENKKIFGIIIQSRLNTSRVEYK